MRIGEKLILDGVVGEEQVEEAIRSAEAGRRGRIGQLLVEKGALSRAFSTRRFAGTSRKSFSPASSGRRASSRSFLPRRARFRRRPGPPHGRSDHRGRSPRSGGRAVSGSARRSRELREGDGPCPSRRIAPPQPGGGLPPLAVRQQNAAAGHPSPRDLPRADRPDPLHAARVRLDRARALFLRRARSAAVRRQPPRSSDPSERPVGGRSEGSRRAGAGGIRRCPRALEKRDYYGAILLLQESVRLAPKNAEYRYRLAGALSHNKNWRARALEQYREALHIDPLRQSLMIEYAELLLLNKKSRKLSRSPAP